VTYVECNRSLETPAYATKIIHTQESGGCVLYEELGIWIAGCQVLHQGTTVWTAGKNGAMTPVAATFKQQWSVKLEEESYSLESSGDALYITKMIPYLITHVLHLIDIVNIWFLASHRQRQAELILLRFSI
jgi:hypothetical protein